MISAALLPLIMILFFSLGWLLIYCLKRNGAILKRGLIVTTIVILFLVHPTLMELNFSMFNCYPLDILTDREIEAKSYLVRDFNIECWESKHLFSSLSIGIPMFSIWIFGAPLFGFIILYRNKDNLDSSHMLMRYRMLYNGLKSEVFYWEFVNTFRKMWIICVNVFFSTFSEEIRALLALSVMLIILKIQD